MSRAGDLAATGIRRGVRNATGNARLGQEAGDYTAAALGFLAPGTTAKVVSSTAKYAKVGRVIHTSAAARRVSVVDTLDLPRGVTVTLEFKEGMDLRDFNRKVTALQDLAERGKLSKAPNPVQRDSRLTRNYRQSLMESAAERFGITSQRYESFRQRLRSMDVDHQQDLQVRGLDLRSNLGMLDSATNQGIGRQLRQQIKKLPDHTVINKIIKKD